MSHIAIDIGGSLVKLVYFSPSDPSEQGSADGTHRGGRGLPVQGSLRVDGGAPQLQSGQSKATLNWLAPMLLKYVSRCTVAA